MDQFADSNLDITEPEYRELRQRLIVWFRLHRCFDPESLADEVFKRVLENLRKKAPTVAMPLRRQCFDVARFLLNEERHDARRKEALPRILPAETVDPIKTILSEEQATLQSELLERGLRSIPAEEQAFLRKYLADGPEVVAQQFGITRVMAEKRFWKAKAAVKRAVERGNLATPANRLPNRRSSPKPARSAAGGEEVRFTSFHPSVAAPERWHTMLVYVHSSAVAPAVRADAHKFFDELGPLPRESESKAGITLHRGTILRIVPRIKGVEFNPKQVQLAWSEDFARASFRCRPTNIPTNEPIIGEISVFLRLLEIATIRIAMMLHPQAIIPQAVREETTHLYTNIFPSYSRDDAAIVASCKTALEAIGCNVLQDIHALRSGERWNTAIETLIDRADVFQLFWSASAAQSTPVADEWHYALQACNRRSESHRDGERFIRPVYWEEPLPSVPTPLAHLHFKYVPGFRDIGHDPPSGSH